MAHYLRFCPQCGTTAYPRTVTPGSIIIELAMWLFFLLPGLIYSLWRLTSRHKACAACGYRDIIPASSPRARAMLAQPRR